MKTRTMSIPVESIEKLERICAAKLLAEGIKTSPVKMVVEMIDKMKDVKGVDDA